MTTAIRNCTFAFKCDKRWEDLKQGSDPDIRFCGACQRNVHFCHTADQLKKAIILNRCVTIEIADKSGNTDRLTGSPVRSFDDSDDDTPF